MFTRSRESETPEWGSEALKYSCSWEITHTATAPTSRCSGTVFLSSSLSCHYQHYWSHSKLKSDFDFLFSSDTTLALGWITFRCFKCNLKHTTYNQENIIVYECFIMILWKNPSLLRWWQKKKDWKKALEWYFLPGYSHYVRGLPSPFLFILSSTDRKMTLT